MDKVRTPPKTKEEKIKLLQEQLADRERKAAEYSAKLQARIKLITARGSSDDRKNDTRRKILLGAMLQNRIEKRKIAQANIDKWMSQFLTRDEDRKLFDLAPIIIDNPDLDSSDEATGNKIDNDDCYISEITVDEKKSELPDGFDNYN